MDTTPSKGVSKFRGPLHLGELILSRAGRYREVEGNLWVKEVKVAEEGDRYIVVDP